MGGGAMGRIASANWARARSGGALTFWGKPTVLASSHPNLIGEESPPEVQWGRATLHALGAEDDQRQDRRAGRNLRRRRCALRPRGATLGAVAGRSEGNARGGTVRAARGRSRALRALKGRDSGCRAWRW